MSKMQESILECSTQEDKPRRVAWWVKRGIPSPFAGWNRGLKGRTRFAFDKDTFTHLYIEQRLPTYKIAKQLGCSSTTVCRLLNQFDIPRRSLSEAATNRQDVRRIIKVSLATEVEPRPAKYRIVKQKEDLAKLYLDGSFTVKEIAERLGCSYTTVYNSLRRFGMVPLRKVWLIRLTSPRRIDKRDYQKEWGRRPEVRKRRRELYRMKCKAIRDALINSLGGQCYVCGGDKKLLLHHLFYQNDDDRLQQTIKTLAEAQKHPERFIVLCRVCHRDLHWMLRQPDRLEKFQHLFQQHQQYGVQTGYDISIAVQAN